MSRFSDFRVQAPVRTLPSVLPAIDWSSIGAQAPAAVPVNYQGPNAPLPLADIVIFTWTDNEWSAFDHVFLHGSIQGATESSSLTHKWLQYSNAAPAGSSQGGPLWGYYQLVEIQAVSGTKRVLLMKADAHLAHPPWLNGVESMVKVVAADAKPAQIYSIGTAGGASVNQRLGDVSITNGGTLQLKEPANVPSGLSGKTFASNWFPDLSLIPKVQPLFFPLSRIATEAGLQSVLDAAKSSHDEGAQQLVQFNLGDLINAAIDPANLGAPKAVNFKGTPLFTTDYYFIGTGESDYAALEMDDAVVGYAANLEKIDFVFVRNISDTLVPVETPTNQAIPDPARRAWSSAVYNAYGMFTSFNGALAAWAAIAAS
jgi:hypothetical protein